MFSDSPQKTYLFSLRLWQVVTSEGEHEWRGKLQFLPAGEAVYFHGLAALPVNLEALLASATQLDDTTIGGTT